MPPFNPLVVFTKNDRFAEYRRARAECPVSQSRLLPMWNVMCYDDCVRVLRDPEHFASSPRVAFERKAQGAKGLTGALDMAQVFELLPPMMQHMMVATAPPITSACVHSLQRHLRPA
ncbi:MAG: hypothetical protein KDH09_09870 [Chrysiogenetes bacterium]|nr:hypothetical protein [Chrysiogenetes bacterium]